MDMGIVAIANGLSNMKTQQALGVGMLKKSMEQMEQVGEQMVEMIDAAAESFAVDISV
jgi:hypothetical protein